MRLGDDPWGRVSTSLAGHGTSSYRGRLVARSLGLLGLRPLRYRDHPELAKVKVATGEENGLPEGQLGVVTAKAEGYSTCDQLIAEALTELLAEARSLGGSGVQQVKFRRRWYWSGHDPVCRRSLLGGESVEARGVAVK
jgi:hypothetical protein